MKRPLRSSILPIVAALALLAVALLLPGGAVSSPMALVTSTPTTRPTPTSGCFGCLNATDAICWENGGCFVVVVRTPPLSTMVTARFRTVAMTARPQIDYVDVRAGTVVLQPGQSSAEIRLALIANPQATQERTFGVELFAVSGADLVKPMATVTIRSGPGPN